MMRRQAAILAALLVCGLLVGNEADAKGPAFNGDYTFAQLMWLVVMPAIVASVILVMIGLYAKQNPQLSAK